MRKGAFVLVLVGLALASLPLVAQTSDPHFGTWKLNVAKSKRDSAGGPMNRSQTRTYEPFEGNGVKLTVDTVAADGTHAIGGYSAHFDGKPYPDRGNNVNFDHVAMKRVDPSTYEATQMKAGKVYSTNVVVISKDGKTMTVTAKGANSSGQPFTNVLVFDKQ